MRGRTCYGSEVFGDTYQRSIVLAHALLFTKKLYNNENKKNVLLINPCFTCIFMLYRK